MDRRVPNSMYFVAHDTNPLKARRVPDPDYIIFLKIDLPFRMWVSGSMDRVKQVSG